MANRTLIVGAGLSGLTCARKLAEAGRGVTLLDKGNRPGGRLSTRVSRSGPTFDHGAQYFTAKSATFTRQVSQWVGSGHAALWEGNIVDLDHGSHQSTKREAKRYVGTPKMETVVETAMAEVKSGGDVDGPHFGVEVKSLRQTDGAWVATDGDGTMYAGYTTVVLALPAPQSRALLGGVAPDLAAELAEVKVEPCWSLMLAFDEPLGLGFDGAFVEHPPLRWISRDSDKPGRPEGESWVVHAGGEWSQEHVEDDREAVVAALSEAFAEAAGVELPEPTYAAAHRWRFAHVAEPLTRRWIHDAERGLAVCGDALTDGATPNIERAYLSGLALGERLAG